MKKSNKGVLILIIVLLVIFTGLSAWGISAKLMGVNKPPEPENVNREFKFNNKLYFYDMLTLVGTYECKTSSCDYAKGTIDDSTYSLNYYSKASDSSTSLISKRYAFLTDGSENIILYDVVNSSVVNTFKAVKNYGIGIDNNYYILEDLNNKWGVMKIDSTAGLTIDYSYDFVGLHDELKEGTTLLNSDVFVVKNNEGWKLVSNTNVDKSAYFTNQIYDYNDKYVITKNGSYYYIYSIASANLLMSNLFSYTKFIGDYIAVIDSNNDYYLLNPETLMSVSQKYKITSPEEVTLEETTSGISLSIGGELKEVVK